MKTESMEESLVPSRLLRKVKPEENGRLAVTWRIYDAICQIPTGDLSIEQCRILDIERAHAFRRWEVEGELMDRDGLQGKRGFAAAKKQHLKELQARTKKKQ